MLKKEATFDWTEQCENAFKPPKEELTKMQPYSTLIQINHCNYLQTHPNIATLEFFTRRKKEKQIQACQD